MERNLNILFFFQIFVALCVLMYVSLGFVMTWLLFYLQVSKDKKRPGINIKEL